MTEINMQLCMTGGQLESDGPVFLGAVGVGFSFLNPAYAATPLVMPLYMKPRHIISLGVYYGGEQTRYMNSDLNKYFSMRQPEFNSAALFVLQKFNWLISDRVLVNEVFGYLHYFDDSVEFTQYGTKPRTNQYNVSSMDPGRLHRHKNNRQHLP